MIASVEASAKIAVMIGSAIATSVPNVNARITIAAMIPISSLDSVDGVDTFCPSWPPVCTSSPAALSGPEAASMMSCACSVDKEPGLTFVVTEM